MSVFSASASLVTSLADLLTPVFHSSATAAAIVVFTVLVRLALHPLARAAARGERVRSELAPPLAELRQKHGRNPERLQREAAKLYAGRGASPLAGCLPMLLQLPVFFVMYHLFTTEEALLGESLLGAQLGDRWADALSAGGPFGAEGLVYGGLFAVIAVVASWTYWRARRSAADAQPGAAGGAGVGASGARAGTGTSGAGAGAPGAALLRFLPLLSFGTLVTAAVVPLAAGLYLVTTTTWSAVERALLVPLRRPATRRPTR
ncbi:protein translocase component YidC [Streptomyces armeniacus]|uniref:Membrane protein insertase YidC n=1 Tax=Streptomyces armeniacus TaxID=83291 RepID=A0A345XRQ2_9ACTN|nr:membrane protein insertase YidC [Streptomyces armeniacus]AXK34318.1 protein translocase component YidC [Streptomyces armeniacus]